MRMIMSSVVGCALCVGQFGYGGEAKTSMEDVKFTAKCDGAEQRYVMILPAHFVKNESHDVLIALHGHGSDRWQFAKDPRDECKAARDAAAERAMIFVSPDYRAKTSWMGPKAEADMLQIIAELKAKDIDDIGIFQYLIKIITDLYT